MKSELETGQCLVALRRALRQLREERDKAISEESKQSFAHTSVCMLVAIDAMCWVLDKPSEHGFGAAIQNAIDLLKEHYERAGRIH